MENYNCNTNCEECSGSCNHEYSVDSKNMYSQKNSYSNLNEEEQKYRVFGGY